MNVLLTIDTEVYPLRQNWRTEGLRGDIARDIYGETDQGSFGLTYQLETLNAHRLKAVFMVEGLFAEAVGLDPLRRIVREITDAGQEVQIHAHPEWLAWMAHPPLPPNGRETFRQFSLEEQSRLIQLASNNLRMAGAAELLAFRAGDFAANADTLRALHGQGLRFDTSLDPCWPHSLDDLPGVANAVQPFLTLGVCEVPVSYWHPRPLPRRHAELCAASKGELGAALWAARRADWRVFVIVSHSFELLGKRRSRVERPAPDWTVIRRFGWLCEFLDRHRDRFNTCGFSELTVDRPAAPAPIYPPFRLAAWRHVEQAYRRLVS
jgi:hypothetical protein